MLCGMGFYNVLARKPAHRNTSTTPRPAHQIRKKKVIIYHFYSMYSVQALQEDRTQNEHPLQKFAEELPLKELQRKP